VCVRAYGLRMLSDPHSGCAASSPRIIEYTLNARFCYSDSMRRDHHETLVRTESVNVLRNYSILQGRPRHCFSTRAVLAPNTLIMPHPCIMRPTGQWQSGAFRRAHAGVVDLALRVTAHEDDDDEGDNVAIHELKARLCIARGLTHRQPPAAAACLSALES